MIKRKYFFRIKITHSDGNGYSWSDGFVTRKSWFDQSDECLKKLKSTKAKEMQCYHKKELAFTDVEVYSFNRV